MELTINVNLSRCPLDERDIQFLSQCAQMITYLDLSFINFDKIPSFSFHAFTKLETLNIRKCSLTQLPDLPSTIVSLDISENLFRECPVELGNYPNLMKLVMRNNKWESLPSSLGKLTKLYHLDITGCRITLLPFELENCPIGNLMCGGNPLSFLPNLNKLAYIETEDSYLLNTVTSENVLVVRPALNQDKFNYLTDLPVGYLVNVNKASDKDESLLCSQLSLYKVVSLKFGEGTITEFTQDLIRSVPHLERFNIYGSTMIKISPEIYNLPLTSLSLMQNWTLPQGVKKFTDLTTLSMSNMNCPCLEEIGCLSNLTILSLSGMHLTDLPDSIANCKSLYHVNLSHNELKSLPSCLTSLPIGYLSMSENELTNIDGVEKIVTLISLNLENNKLVNFPNRFGDLVNLELLSADDNKLERLPQSICNCGKLNMVSLRNNVLEAFPQFPSSIERLYLDNNKIEDISDDLAPITNLQEFFLPSNPLKNVPRFLSGCYKLEELNLAFNKFVEFNIALPSSLRHLSLDGVVLPRGPDLTNLDKLIGLTYTGCCMETIPYFPPNLVNIDIRGNYISNLPPQTKDLKRLKVLMVCNNSKLDYSKMGPVYELMLESTSLTHLYLSTYQVDEDDPLYKITLIATGQWKINPNQNCNEVSLTRRPKNIDLTVKIYKDEEKEDEKKPDVIYKIRYLPQ